MRAKVVVLAGLAFLAAPASAQAQPEMPAPLVYFHIAGPDLAKQRAFYAGMFGWTIGEDGSLTIPAQPAMSGMLQVEPPNLGPETGSALYFGVVDVTAAQAQAMELGGAVVFPRLEVPGVVVLGMITDPAGNRVGLIEWKDGKPVVPAVPGN
ncbi:VOC family protein [Altererythrobacter fulvus]|uniref:VOC family protein n=1 Tax=Caenibius fulvus TaxID=2126012 RepID=UPI00301615DF